MPKRKMKGIGKHMMDSTSSLVKGKRTRSKAMPKISLPKVNFPKTKRVKYKKLKVRY